MAINLHNPKSDVPAKQAFIQHLLRDRRFDEARVTRHPADVTAIKSKQVHYFEIKFTAQATTYFGAATLTEWEAALANESNFWFVVASMNDGEWDFQEYTPSEFMSFSYIPPFKIFFSVPIGVTKLPRPARRRADFVSVRVPMTRERLSAMIEIYKRFRSKLS